MSKVVGILLAAGQSSRFGSNKCLAQLPDRTAMGIHSARNLSAVVDQLVCVVPPNTLELQSLFVYEGFTTSFSLLAEQGMSESLKAGVEYFNDDQAVTGFVIALADMPLIMFKSYQSIVTELRSNAGIVLPTYQGRQGHPVGFSAKYRDELLALKGDQGAKVLFQKYKKDITLINVDDPGIHQDFDTLSTFERYFHEHTA